MKSTRSPTEFDQNNRDVTSVPGYVIKKDRKRGVQHGASERQRMYDVNMAIWCIFLNATLQAAVHLGQEREE